MRGWRWTAASRVLPLKTGGSAKNSQSPAPEVTAGDAACVARKARGSLSGTGQKAGGDCGPRRLFDHLICGGKQGSWYDDFQLPGRIEIDHQFKFGRLQDRKPGCIHAPENSTNVD